MTVSAQDYSKIDDRVLDFLEEINEIEDYHTSESNSNTLLRALERTFIISDGIMPFSITDTLFKKTLRNFLRFLQFRGHEVALESYFSILDARKTDEQVLVLGDSITELSLTLFANENKNKKLPPSDWLGFVTLNLFVDFLKKNQTVREHFFHHIDLVYHYMIEKVKFGNGSFRPLGFSAKEYNDKLVYFFKKLGIEPNEGLLKQFISYSRDEPFITVEDVILSNVKLLQFLSRPNLENLIPYEGLALIDWPVVKALNFMVTVMRKNKNVRSKVSSMILNSDTSSSQFFEDNGEI